MGQDLPSTFLSFLKSLDQTNPAFQGEPLEASSDQVIGRASAFLRKEGPMFKGDFHQVPLLMGKEGQPQVLEEGQLLDIQGAKKAALLKKSSSLSRSFQDGQQLETQGPEKAALLKKASSLSRSFQDGQQLETQGPKKEAFLKRNILQFRPLEGDQLQGGALRRENGPTILKRDSFEGNKFLDSREAKVESKQGEILKTFKKQTQVGPQSPSVQGANELNVPLERPSMGIMGIRKFQNHFKDQSLFRPIDQRSETRLQDISSHEAHSHAPVMTAKEFLGGLQSQPLNTIGHRTSSPQLFDMGGPFHSVDTYQLIERISQYIIQHSAGSAKEIDLSVKHPEIGSFRVNVSQDLVQPGVQLVITAFSREGADFFGLNQTRLLSNLDQNGVKVQDFKLEQQLNGGQYSSSHESDQEAYSQARQDAERRRQLWEQFSKGMS